MLVFTGKSSRQGLLGGAGFRPSTVWEHAWHLRHDFGSFLHFPCWHPTERLASASRGAQGASSEDFCGCVAGTWLDNGRCEAGGRRLNGTLKKGEWSSFEFLTDPTSRKRGPLQNGGVAFCFFKPTQKGHVEEHTHTPREDFGVSPRLILGIILDLFEDRSFWDEHFGSIFGGKQFCAFSSKRVSEPHAGRNH